jgi:hypothetical protein
VQCTVGIDECEVLALFFSKLLLHELDKPLDGQTFGSTNFEDRQTF